MIYSFLSINGVVKSPIYCVVAGRKMLEILYVCLRFCDPLRLVYGTFYLAIVTGSTHFLLDGGWFHPGWRYRARPGWRTRKVRHPLMMHIILWNLHLFGN